MSSPSQPSLAAMPAQPCERTRSFWRTDTPFPGTAQAHGEIVASEPMNVLLAALLLLNLLDAVLTLFWVTLGITTEENPLMAAALSVHPIAFILAKLGLVGLAVLVIHVYRHRRGVKTASSVLVAIYYWIALSHAWFYGSVVVPALFF